MRSPPEQDIVVLAVGNSIHSDDGAGIHALQVLKDDQRLPTGVTLIDGGTRGLELLASVYECPRLLLLDAVDVGVDAGTVVRLEGEGLRGLGTANNVHQLAVADLLNTLALVSDIERDIVLLGVQPATTDWGTELSKAVAAAVDEVVERAIEQLQVWAPISDAHAA